MYTALKGAVRFSALITIFTIVFIIFYVTVKGAPHLSADIFSLKYTSENLSMTPALINTVVVVFISLLVSVPLGLFTAVYLAEYASNARVLNLIRASIQTLAGVPSIVYGLFGLIFFVTALKLGFSILSGSLTLAIMVLPVIIRTAEEGFLSVPVSFRAGSFALGAGKLRTVFVVVLPAAMPGIAAGIILSIGRIVGESAALIFTAGTVAKAATGLFDSGRTLSVHTYALSSEGLHPGEAFATAFALLILTALINFISSSLFGKVK